MKGHQRPDDSDHPVVSVLCGILFFPACLVPPREGLEPEDKPDWGRRVVCFGLGLAVLWLLPKFAAWTSQSPELSQTALLLGLLVLVVLICYALESADIEKRWNMSRAGVVMQRGYRFVAGIIAPSNLRRCLQPRDR